MEGCSDGSGTEEAPKVSCDASDWRLVADDASLGTGLRVADIEGDDTLLADTKYSPGSEVDPRIVLGSE